MVMLRIPGLRFTVAAAFCAALVAVSASPAVAASQAREGIPAANPAALGSQPNVVIRDRVLPLGRGAHSAAVSDVVPANAFSGSYTANGMKIKIAISPSYSPDAAEAQSWADFLAGLPQSGDAATMTVYFAPLSKMQGACGPDADACYDSGGRTRIGSSHLRGRSDSVTRTLCGQRTVIARVTRAFGSGSFKLTTTTPAL
jgi:hypothetical protein